MIRSFSFFSRSSSSLIGTFSLHQLRLQDAKCTHHLRCQLPRIKPSKELPYLKLFQKRQTLRGNKRSRTRRQRYIPASPNDLCFERYQFCLPPTLTLLGEAACPT